MHKHTDVLKPVLILQYALCAAIVCVCVYTVYCAHDQLEHFDSILYKFRWKIEEERRSIRFRDDMNGTWAIENELAS